jgi:glucose/arabinose dehydrogenase
VRSAAAALSLAAALLLAGSARASAPALSLTEAAHGLAQPDYVTATPADPGALYVVEKPGTIERVVGDVTDPTAFLDISRLVATAGDQGLQSLLFSPAYATDHTFYVDYTGRDGSVTVAQYRSRTGKPPRQVRILLRVTHAREPDHNGGQIAFGPDGRMYVGLGDSGCCGDVENVAQNPKSRLGKLLRAAPPFRHWEIAGYGLRNPWRFSFDSATGDLYLADVGQDAWEEIDHRAAADLPAPANYGWSRWEGTHPYNTSVAINPGPPVPLVFPVYEYPHGPDCAVMGGYVYHGSLMPDEDGRYFFTDYCSGVIRTLTVSDGALVDERDENVPPVSAPTSFGLDAAGELYVVSMGDGAVYRLSE